MSPPTIVWILGFEYRITNEESLALQWQCGFDGFLDRYTHSIHINPKVGIDRQRETLLHEILHAHDDSLSLAPQREARTCKCEPHRVTYALHEDTVQRWTRTFLATLRDPRNKAVVDWLFTIPGAHP